MLRLPQGELRQDHHSQPPPGRLFHRLRLLPQGHGPDLEGAVFNHSQVWPLLGAHKTLDCNQCHASGYDLPRDCYGCHQADYDNTTNPNHRQAGYSTTCDNCHFSSHTSWNQAVFTHKFPIKSGKHCRLRLHAIAT